MKRGKDLPLSTKEKITSMNRLEKLSPKRIAEKLGISKIIATLEKTARKVIKPLRMGIKFTPTQPNSIRIENLMLSDLQSQKELALTRAERCERASRQAMETNQSRESCTREHSKERQTGFIARHWLGADIQQGHLLSQSARLCHRRQDYAETSNRGKMNVTLVYTQWFSVCNNRGSCALRSRSLSGNSFLIIGPFMGIP